MIPDQVVHPAARADRATRLVVIAASAGGVQALRTLLAALPAAFPVPIVIVLHRSERHEDLLARVLTRWTRLRVRDAKAGDVLEPGTVYVAPPARHVVIAPDARVTLTDGRRIRYVLSSANPLFESAAGSFGRGVIGVVLTGTGQDATDGVQSIHATGGTVIVQEPATAAHAGMPSSAIATGAANYVLPLDRIGPALVELVAAEPASA